MSHNYYVLRQGTMDVENTYVTFRNFSRKKVGVFPFQLPFTIVQLLKHIFRESVIIK